MSPVANVFRSTLSAVEVHDSARKHGVADEDIHHSLDQHLLSKTPAKILTVGWSSGLIAPATSRDGRPDDHRGHSARDPRDADAAKFSAAGTMTEGRVYGHTRSGQPITDTEVQALAAEAEAGYDVDALIARRPKRGRPALGSSPASVESVRLDPELREELLQRARTEGTTTSELIREALRRFLRAA